MTTKTIPDAPACDSETAVCCPPEGQTVELLLAPVEGPATNENGPRVSYCIVPSALKRMKALLKAM